MTQIRRRCRLLRSPPQPRRTLSLRKDPQTPGITSARSDKILIADDSEIILQLLSNVLESENFRIITAANGREALRLAMQERPDLIVTDLLMPEMDGITLIKKLKSHLATRYIPVIMLTRQRRGGRGSEGNRRRR